MCGFLDRWVIRLEGGFTGDQLGGKVVGGHNIGLKRFGVLYSESRLGDD